MKIESERLLEILLLVIGIIMCIIVKNSARFMGVGLISLSTTYLLIDNIGIYLNRKTIYNKRNKSL